MLRVDFAILALTQLYHSTHPTCKFKKRFKFNTVPFEVSHRRGRERETEREREIKSEKERPNQPIR